jgi:hypothetical protein
VYVFVHDAIVVVVVVVDDRRLVSVPSRLAYPAACMFHRFRRPPARSCTNKAHTGRTNAREAKRPRPLDVVDPTDILDSWNSQCAGCFAAETCF